MKAKAHHCHFQSPPQCLVRMPPHRILLNFLLILYPGYIWHVIWNFPFSLIIPRSLFHSNTHSLCYFLKSYTVLKHKNYSYMEAYLSHLWFGLFILLSYLLQELPLWMGVPIYIFWKTYTRLLRHYSASWLVKRVLVTEFIKLYSRKTGVGEPRHWRDSLALSRTMWRETYQKFSNMRLVLYW